MVKPVADIADAHPGPLTDLAVLQPLEIFQPNQELITLVLKGTSGSSVGDVRINGGAIVDLIAPATGDYAGIVIYKSATATGDGDNKLNGGMTMNIQGAVYIPSQVMEYVGGADVDGCTYLIGRRIVFSGDTDTFVHADESECNGIGLDDVMQASQQRIVVLLE